MRAFPSPRQRVGVYARSAHRGRRTLSHRHAGAAPRPSSRSRRETTNSLKELRPIRLLVDIGRAGAGELANQELRDRVDAEQRSVLPAPLAIRAFDGSADRLPFLGAHAPLETAVGDDLDVAL